MNPTQQTLTPAVSVAMPVFNEQATIATILKSLLSQNCVLEIVVVDDCSTDGTPEILKDISLSEPRLRVISHSRNHKEKARPFAQRLQLPPGRSLLFRTRISNTILRSIPNSSRRSFLERPMRFLVRASLALARTAFFISGPPSATNSCRSSRT